MVGLGHRPPGKAVWQQGWLQETGSGVRPISSNPPSHGPRGPAQLANPIASWEHVDPDPRAELQPEAPDATLTAGTKFMGHERRAELWPWGQALEQRCMGRHTGELGSVFHPGSPCPWWGR